MHFYTVVALAAIATSANAQLPGLGGLGGAAAAPAAPKAKLTAQEVKASIEEITDKAADTEVIAQRIKSKADGFQVGPELIVSIKEINQLFTKESEALAAQDEMPEAPELKEPEAAEPAPERRQLPVDALSGLLGQKKAPGKAPAEKRQLPVGALGGLLGQKEAPAKGKKGEKRQLPVGALGGLLGQKEAPASAPKEAPVKAPKEATGKAQKAAPAKALKGAPVKAQEQKRQLPGLPLPGLDSVTNTLSPGKPEASADEPVLEQIFFAVEDQAEICYAFTDLTKVHEMMLNSVIEKREFFTFNTITAQTAKVLRLLEREFDEFAAVLIESVPTCAFSVKQDQQQMEKTMKKSIETFTL
ncbi:hypothetical protein CBER1_05252 [Cercospora berteroae]|uniref:Uncharacterized protein n=1 Tax=Cercospora berteroae TaxID=357750 RepID=A0A2S6BT83_9PEZI|nr:hypothetical protein CBER1_05252 [Cercospora berteroae]